MTSVKRCFGSRVCKSDLTRNQNKWIPKYYSEVKNMKRTKSPLLHSVNDPGLPECRSAFTKISRDGGKNLGKKCNVIEKLKIKFLNLGVKWISGPNYCEQRTNWQGLNYYRNWGNQVKGPLHCPALPGRVPRGPHPGPNVDLGVGGPGQWTFLGGGPSPGYAPLRNILSEKKLKWYYPF